MTIWLVCLAGYCALQTAANAVQVEMQDLLLLAMPLIAAAASVAALRGAPRLAMFWRLAIGGAAAFVFGHAYFQYFRWVIVETLHIWDRAEGLLWNLATFVGLLIAVGAVLGAIGGAMFGAGQKKGASA